MAVTACSRSDRSTGLGPRIIPLGQPVPKGGGVYKVGTPYSINGKWYRPSEDPTYDRVGTASWYGELFHGRYTANGEIYDMDALSAAHPTLPMPTYVRVTNLENGRSLVVRVNDRGPYASDRIIDMSQRSAELLGFKRQGTARVRVTYIGPAPLNGDDSYERRVLASQSWIRAATLDGKKAPRAVTEPMTVASIASARTAEPDQSAPAYFVQAAAFRERDRADAVRARLAGHGQVAVYPAEVGGAIWYRVRLGPFAALDDADQALQRVRASVAPDARIVRH